VTRLSDRYALSTGVVLAIFLIATSYGRSQPQRDECPSNEVLLDAQAIDASIEILTEGRPATSIEEGRLVGRLAAPDDRTAPLILTINRTFGLRNRVLQPAITLPGRREPDEVEASLLQTPDGPIPVHYAYERRGSHVRVAGYFMTYRGEAVRSPLWTRVRSGTAAIRGGSWPITLFAVSSVGHPSQLEENRSRMESWLLDAWDHYRRVCRSDSPAT
jgi:hypothetical protein